MIPLIAGSVLALLALSFVLYPLLVTSPTVYRPEVSASPDEAQSNSAIDALREIEFDRETGKLSETDYSALKTEYTQRAVAVMRAGGGPVCDVCGPRPERDALFCSNCGLPVPGEQSVR
ncbi:MAG TPA: hypothetical protein VM099_07465 [Gemmatimonadaceae bacterium]|nr:hypothetical protein [Gemmatimonadaceae bacterium]